MKIKLINNYGGYCSIYYLKYNRGISFKQTNCQPLKPKVVDIFKKEQNDI